MELSAGPWGCLLMQVLGHVPTPHVPGVGEPGSGPASRQACSRATPCSEPGRTHTPAPAPGAGAGVCVCLCPHAEENTVCV